MELNSGIRILTGNKEELYHRIWLSTGTEPAEGAVDNIPYEPMASKPRNNWRKPTPSELDLLVTDNTGDGIANTISIIELPEELRKEIADLGLPAALSYGDLMSIRKSDPSGYMDLMEKIYEFKNSFLLREDDYHRIDFNVKKRQRETLTIDIPNHQLTGLHFDAWEYKTMDKMQQVTNRICLNLGKKSRFFLFINLSLKAVYDMVKDHSNINISLEYDKDPLCQQFLAAYPNYPVIKLMVKPYEAYIAPTENMIHDGSSWDPELHANEEDEMRDITLTTRGYFSLTPLKQVQNS